eukprot:COSAG02_NODE_8262_length_2638_cov_9.241140_1_plen_81_part_00
MNCMLFPEHSTAIILILTELPSRESKGFAAKPQQETAARQDHPDHARKQVRIPVNTLHQQIWTHEGSLLVHDASPASRVE